MANESQLRIISLASGSSGNATLITDGETSLLVDCGLSAREICRRLTAAGVNPGSVKAILVTHEHSDHVRGIDVFLRRHAGDCTVYATRGTIAADPMMPVAERTRRIEPGASVSIGKLRATAFSTSHDAAQPAGYRIDSGTLAVGILTDTGVVTGEAREVLAGCDVLGLECNHDEEMLERGPYPAFLKRRIRSSVGHLANSAACEALDALASDRLKAVFALHRSETNNTERLAAASVSGTLRRLGLNARTVAARQDASTEVVLPLE